MEEKDYMELFEVCPPVADDKPEEMSKIPEETPDSVHESETLAEESPADAQPGEGTESAPGKARQSRSENAKYAKARREAEAERDQALADVEERIKQAREEGRREGQNSLLQKAGLENPYDHTQITDIDQFDAYWSKHKEAEQQQRLRDMSMTQEQYDEYVGNLPEVQEARRLTQQAKDAQFKAQVEREIAEISQWNPAIKSVSDLAKDPKYPDILSMVERNYSLPDAYKLAHLDDLTTRKGRQQSVNAAGKAHMVSTQSKGVEGGVPVPSDEMAMFHMLCGDVSDEEIGRFYNRMTQPR